jgi:hypothetical protein
MAEHKIEKALSRLYTVEDIREIFGCGKNKAYGIVASAGFPKIQIGRQYYIMPDEFDKWLLRNTLKSARH